MSIKILATADLHLGKRSADVIVDHNSTKYILQRLVKYCIDKNIDVLLLCGDIVDWDNRFFEAYGPLQEAFDSLGKQDIQVFLVAGNHDFDVLPHIIKTGNNPHVHLLGRDEEWEVKQYKKNEQTIQFVGWSFAKRHVKENAMLSWNSATLNSDLQSIGLLHGDTEARDSQYGPLNVDDFRNAGVDLWLLGHIHKPQQILDNPGIWYTGSPQALSGKESGKHGPLLITVTPGLPIGVEQIEMSPVRYESVSIDITGIANESELREKVIFDLNKHAEGIITELESVLSLIYRITLVGKSSLVRQIEIWKNTITDYNEKIQTGTTVTVRRVTAQISPEIVDLKQLAQQSSPAGILANTILAIDENKEDEFLNDLIREWKMKNEAIHRVGAFSPLGAKERFFESNQDNALSAIKEACNRVLGELMNQIKPN